MHRLKWCEYNNKDKGNVPNTQNDKIGIVPVLSFLSLQGDTSPRVMFIAVGNRHGDPSSNPRLICLNSAILSPAINK